MLQQLTEFAQQIARLAIGSLRRTSCCSCSRAYTTNAQSPHPALTILPDYLDATEQDVLLRNSLRLLDSPARTNSAGRKRRRDWIKQNPHWDGRRGFMADEAYAWEEGHFDGVIKRYREMLVREGMWASAPPLPDAEQLEAALAKIYSLLPPPATAPSEIPPRSPPSHLILHLLHLASDGAIYPHVDNLEAFGRTIVGVSLGGERVMRFKRSSESESETGDPGPTEFEVLLEPGSAYIQRCGTVTVSCD